MQLQEAAQLCVHGCPAPLKSVLDNCAKPNSATPTAADMPPGSAPTYLASALPTSALSTLNTTDECYLAHRLHCILHSHNRRPISCCGVRT